MWSLVALIQLARAAPVELPTGEDPAAWEHALSLVGLEVGAVGDGPGVRVEGGSAWTLHVRDEQGEQHVLTVAAPSDGRAREEVAFLAASLLHPVDEIPSVGLPPLPPPAPAPVPDPVPVPVPVPVPDPEPEPEPDDAVALAPPPPPLPDLGPPAEIVLPPGERARAWASAGPALALRPSVRSMISGSVRAGVALPDAPVRLGLGVSITAPAVLLRVSGERRVQCAEVLGTALLAPGRTELGPLVGMSRRAFTDPVDSPPEAWIPVLGASVAYRVPTGPVAVRVGLDVLYDLVPTEVYVGGVAEGRMPPLGAALSLGVSTR